MATKPRVRRAAARRNGREHAGTKPTHRPVPDPLLDLALAYHEAALRTGDAGDVSVAHLLEAALVISRRRKAGAEPALREREALERAVAKYTATRTPDERIAYEALPAKRYARAAAVKALRARTADGVAYVRSAPAHKREGFARVVAAALIDKVGQLGLAKDRMLRSESALRAVVEALLESRVRVDRVCALALRCRGVSRFDAANWTRAALTD